ncbi:pitrilysin family protein [Legionella sp. km772]|uniref:M16 family metallopeptidase n=1 Tax=Legionella sp. km772 TaxID=2498111 RepID=UPI000F8D8D6F|nr:pitrilysin family protein [Legionella sp. km772]RUR13671.1 insulinase family protein [Legionella sp. km772]
MSSFKNILSLVLLVVTPLSIANTFKTEHWTTKNGVTVVFYQAPEVPMLDISIAFAAGSAYDQKSYGLSALTAQMLNEGSSGIDSTTLAEQLDNTGAQFDTTTNKDMVVFSLRTLTSKEELNQATSTFAQILNHPDFPQEALEREKKQFYMAIAQAQSSPDTMATDVFFQHLYQEHPYAHPTNGTATSIKKIKREEVVQFYKQYYVANNATLVFVGAIDSQTAHQLADKLTLNLSPGKAAAPIDRAPPLAAAKQVHLPFPSSQTTIRLGQLGIDHSNPHYFPLMVGNYILGGASLTSKLAIEVREKQGLTYSIESQFVPMPGPGPFVVALSTQNQQVNAAVSLTEEVLNTYIQNGPSLNELEAAKNYLKGSFPLSLASNKTIASLLLRMTFYHLPADYLDTYLDKINKVTQDDIKKAFQQEVHPKKLLQVTVGQV